MVDHVAQFRVWYSAVNLDSVPVFLVHVIARPNLLISVAKFESQIRIALQIRCRGNLIERSNREHLATHFKVKNILTKRHVIDRPRLNDATLQKRIADHRQSESTHT